MAPSNLIRGRRILALGAKLAPLADGPLAGAAMEQGTVGQLDGLTAVQVAAITTTDFRALTSTQLNSFATTQMAAILAARILSRLKTARRMDATIPTTSGRSGCKGKRDIDSFVSSRVSPPPSRRNRTARSQAPLSRAAHSCPAARTSEATRIDLGKGQIKLARATKPAKMKDERMIAGAVIVVRA